VITAGAERGQDLRGLELGGREVASAACTFMTVAKPIAVSESTGMLFGAYFLSTAMYRLDCVVPASGASTGEE
jgi:hypothetical protein